MLPLRSGKGLRGSAKRHNHLSGALLQVRGRFGVLQDVLQPIHCRVPIAFGDIDQGQLFLCQQRGLDPEKAVSMIVNGFCKDVFKELPMEFAVEAQKLLQVSLEGAVG